MSDELIITEEVISKAKEKITEEFGEELVSIEVLYFDSNSLELEVYVCPELQNSLSVDTLRSYAEKVERLYRGGSLWVGTEKPSILFCMVSGDVKKLISTDKTNH